MASSGEQTKLQARIAAVNTILPSPEERAGIVWEILKKAAPDITDWDVVCFAVNYLGWQSQNIPFLETDAQTLCGLVYTAHYLTNDQNLSTGLKKHGRGTDKADVQSTGEQSEPELNRECSGPDVSSGSSG